MKLTRLELSGFKSFANRVELDFEDGVTAIVGPNGCGKSNISDAVRWVLGEQSPRVLRGARMEEVIFQGTASRRPVSVAEVSLVFDNEDGQLPVAYGEVVVARRLSRSGASEYLLNGTSVRLRDIQDLFRGTGLGSDAGVVMEARLIDALLSDRAEERRALFEEAAEIGLYRDRKRSTERRLEESTDDLTRLQDVIAEVQTQVRSLARQRGKAERHGKLTDQRLGVAAGLARAELDRFAAEEQVLATRQERLEIELPESRSSLTELERERERSVQSRHTAEAQRTEVERRLGTARVEIERLEGDLHVGLERRRNAEQRRTRAVEERGEGQGRAERATRARDAAAEQRSAAENERSAVQGELFTRTEREEEIRGRLADQRELVRNLEESLRRRLESVKLLEGERAALERELADLREEVGRTSARRATLATDRTSAEEASARERREVELRTAGMHEAAAVVEHARHQVASARARETDLRAQQRNAVEGHAQLVARRDALDQLERDRVGLAPAVQRLLAERDEVADGIVGPLADYLRATHGEAGLAERLLGDWIHAVLVTDDRAVERVRAWHATAQPGPLVLLPVRPGPRGTGKRADALNLLEVEPPAVAWAEALLAGQEVLEPTGMAHRRANGAIVLAPAGEPAGPLLRRAELETVTAEAERAAREVARLEGELSAAADGLLASEAALIDATQQAERARGAEHEAALAAEEAARRLEHLDREYRDVDGQHTRLTTRVAEAEGRLVVADQELHEGEVERVQLEERLGTERGTLEAWDAEQETARERRVHWQVEEAQVIARYEASATREEQAAAQASEAEASVSALGDEIEQLGQELQQLTEQIAQWEDALRERRAALVELEGATTDAAEEVERAGTRLEDSEHRLAEARAQVEALGEENHQLELGRVDVAGRKRATTERFEIEWRRAIADLLAHPEPAEGDLETLRSEHERMREQLDAMGPVNPLAVEEHAEEVRRLEFLMTQRDDVLAAKRALEQAVREIDQTARELFLETFTRIRENFHQVFSALFEGGECDVSLADEQDPLETEIEIRAAPRGKRIQRIHLLSSGERTLVAVSLLFAIFLTKPSPFYVMDEVDAPLDDANVGRFVRLLDEFKLGTQFVVITHNPRTMQAADAVYGVTMQEPGVSTIVGVRLGEVERV
jgi:chromosome segregation protein